MVWCWNIPQGSTGTLNIHGLGSMPAFWLIKGPTVSGPCFLELLELFILPPIPVNSHPIYKVLSSFSSCGYLLSALWKYTQQLLPMDATLSFLVLASE